MPDTVLKLADTDEEQRDTLAFERRRSNRYATSGRVTAVQSAMEPGLAKRICSLQMLNMSDTGLGAMSPEAIPTGSPITVFFPPHGPDRGIDLTGYVVRCIPRGHAHEVGVRLASRAAA